MESLFVISQVSGEVFLEKHWRSVISKAICDYFLEKMKISNVSQISSTVVGQNIGTNSEISF